MRKYTECCDVCGKNITQTSGKNGFCIESGYSVGGWGSRQDLSLIHI